MSHTNKKVTDSAKNRTLRSSLYVVKILYDEPGWYTGMLVVGILSWYVISHPGQLSLLLSAKGGISTGWKVKACMCHWNCVGGT